MNEAVERFPFLLCQIFAGWVIGQVAPQDRRPFIAAYWGWSGYLKTFQATRHYDIVKQSTHIVIAPYGISLGVLSLHVIFGLVISVYFAQKRPR